MGISSQAWRWARNFRYHYRMAGFCAKLDGVQRSDCGHGDGCKDHVRFTALIAAVRADCWMVAAISRRKAALTDPMGSVDTKS